MHLYLRQVCPILKHLIANNTLRGSDQRTNQILAHRADVNTVCFVDDNTNVLASGADDGIVKVTSASDIP